MKLKSTALALFFVLSAPLAQALEATPYAVSYTHLTLPTSDLV